MRPLHAVIMAGGSGTRFWPASRAARPKQFLPLADGKPLIQATVDRLSGLCDPSHLWIVTNAVQAKALPKVLPGFPREQIIVEPEARDTAPCVALAVATIQDRDPAAVMAVLPADHVIEPVHEFHRMLRRGVELAQDDETLVTFGVEPTFPATGYGYVECGDPVDDRQPAALRCRRFREKPDRATAEQFLAARTFLWNSGIFVWSIRGITRAIAHGHPGLAACTDKMLAAIGKRNRGLVTRTFKQTPKTSIDYAVMEKAPKVVVVRATVKWDDVGSFPALASIGASDDANNVALLADGASQINFQSQQNIVYAEGKRTVTLFAVQGLVVVAVGDAVLVCPKEKAADLKVLVEHVRAQGRADLL